MSENVSNEIVATGPNNFAAELSAGQTVYSSFKGDDFDTQKKVFGAISASIPLSENLLKKIALRNVVVQNVELADEETGELQSAARIILIDDKGVAYHAISSGIYQSLKNMFGILGQPDTWPTPVTVQVKEIKGRKGFRFMTLELA